MKHLPAFSLVFTLALLTAAGCGKKADSHHHDHGSHGDHAGHSHEPAARKSSHGHTHTAPHGGTAVILGDEAYHLELLLEAETGTMTAYVLDAHMEKFVRCGATEFVVTAQTGGKTETLVFKPVANPATDETVGDTSQFTAQADWLKTTSAFDATLKELTIRGSTFQNVAFNFPKGQ